MAGWFEPGRDHAEEPEPPAVVPGHDDLSTRTPDQLQALRRSRSRNLVLAFGALVAGSVLAALPVGTVMFVPATLLFVGGLFALPVTGWLLHLVAREIARRDPPRGEDGPPAS